MRDSTDAIKTAIQTLIKAAARRLHAAHDSRNFEALQADARKAGKIGGDARRAIEVESGVPIVNSTHYKALRQARQRELQPPLFDSETLPEPGDSD